MDETNLASTRLLEAERRPGLFHAPEKYQLVRVLGSGGMGTVVLARDRSLGRLVALKFLRESCTAFMERFEREARLMARLEHPAIVPIHELGRHEGRMYLAMGYVRGGNLAQADLAPRPLAATLRSVVDALAFTHKNGIVHRDVKPENVLLDAKGRAFLGDFGLAFGPGEGSQVAGERPLAGTPLAMSPEQARGEVVGPSSDVFSLGATTYKQLTGVWPFRGRTLADVLFAIEHHEPRPLRSLAPEVPPALEKLVLRSLAKEPADRFPSMDELGEGLDRFLHRRSLFQLLRPGRRTARPSGPHIHPEDIS